MKISFILEGTVSEDFPHGFTEIKNSATKRAILTYAIRKSHAKAIVEIGDGYPLFLTEFIDESDPWYKSLEKCLKYEDDSIPLFEKKDYDILSENILIKKEHNHEK